MGRKRQKYKICWRLGYNARMKDWSGTKKKWKRKGRYQKGKGYPRNPRQRVNNTDRKEENRGSAKVTRRKKPRRRKDEYRNQLKLRKVRQIRYVVIP